MARYEGSDEELLLSMVEENAQGVGSSFFSRENFGHTMSSFPKRINSKMSSQTSRNPQHV